MCQEKAIIKVKLKNFTYIEMSLIHKWKNLAHLKLGMHLANTWQGETHISIMQKQGQVFKTGWCHKVQKPR